MSEKKQPLEVAPPPYAEVGSSTHLPSPSSSSFQPTYPGIPTHLASHLHNLPSLIRASQEAHQHSRTHADLVLVNLLVPHISSLLQQYATRPSLPPLAQLTLVPGDAVPADWIFTPASPPDRASLRGPDAEIHQLVRVEVDKPAREQLLATLAPEPLESYPSTSAAPGMSRSNQWQRKDEFDDWGRWGDDMDGGSSSERGRPEWLWWNDEVLARRLARHLQPQPPPQPKVFEPPPPLETTPFQPPKSSRWNIFRSPDPLRPAPRPAAPPPRRVVVQEGSDGIVMTVRAEEVTFRRENELGIWESKNGYGLVVRVRPRR